MVTLGAEPKGCFYASKSIKRAIEQRERERKSEGKHRSADWKWPKFSNHPIRQNILRISIDWSDCATVRPGWKLVQWIPFPLQQQQQQKKPLRHSDDDDDVSNLLKSFWARSDEPFLHNQQHTQARGHMWQPFNAECSYTRRSITVSVEFRARGNLFSAPNLPALFPPQCFRNSFVMGRRATETRAAVG